MPGDWSDHVIVCGLHDEGLRIVEQLRQAGVFAVMIDADPDPRLVTELLRLDVPFVSGDSREEAALSAAGLGRAKAVICAESDDLHTLATALLARELSQDVRVVAQLRNAAVGDALDEIGVMVLDVAALAAPAIADACLGAGSQALSLGGRELVVVEAPCERAGTLRDLFGQLFPVGVVQVESGRVTPSPGRDLRVSAGDTAVLLGTHADVAGAGLATASTAPEPDHHHHRGARAPKPQTERRAGVLLEFLRLVDSRVKFALVALGMLSGLSVVLLMVGYREPDGTRMSPLDAIYFTVETIATVGFGDFYFRDQAAWLRWWAIILMAVGAIAAAVFFALITNLLIGRTISQVLGRRELTGMKNHVIVVGAGSVGMGVVDRLRDLDRDVVVVDADQDNRFLGQLRSQHIPTVAADATLADTLAEVRLDTATAIAVMTSDDLVSIETGLAARAQLGERWRQVPVVLRLFDPRLAATVEASFGFRYVRSPAALAAPWFVGAAIGLDVLRTFYVGDLPMLVVRFEAVGSVVGLEMSELSTSVRIVMLGRADGGTEPLPRRHTLFRAGDTVYAIGPYAEILTMVRDYGLA